MGPTWNTEGVKKQLKHLAVLLLAVGISAGWMFWRISGESGKIQQLCGQAQGKSLTQLNADIEQLGLKATFSQGRAVVHGEKTFGRAVCLIEYAGDAVTKAQYNVAD